MGEPSEITERRDAGEHRRDNLIQVGVDPDTWRDFEDYRVERDLTPSEAARRLIRAGLDDTEQPEFLASVIHGLTLAGFVLVAFAAIEADVTLLASGAVAILIAIATNRFGHRIAQQLP